MYTFQDFQKADDKKEFVLSAISMYKTTEEYKMALVADEYDAHRNKTINDTVRMIYSASGVQMEDPTASNNKIACNIFNRLNTQRCLYSLGNGISFVDPNEAARGEEDKTKAALGLGFDHTITEAGYYSLIHGCSYLFWNMDKVHMFKLTEFVPFDDEYDGSLKAGIRFWQLSSSKPLNAILYEMDGYTKYKTDEDGKLEEVQPKRAYKVTYQYTEADDIISTTGENYSSFPIVRMYGSRLKQSTLVGMRAAIDAFDLIQSGFANDLQDCAQIYWIVENYGGMEEQDLAEFLDKLKLNHIVNIDSSAGGSVKPYTQDVPVNARTQFLADIRARIYEDFGALDVHTIAASSTNDHIEAAYQPLDENASDFEYWVSDAIIRLLSLQGIEDKPIFRRNRVSNQSEQINNVLKEAMWLDRNTILRKLPNITPEEAEAIIANSEAEDMARMLTGSDTM